MECLECATVIQPYVSKCDSVILKGGIKGFVLFKCGVVFDDITDLDEWLTKLTAADVVTTRMKRIVGSFPEAAEATVQAGSCDPVELLNFGHSADITDRNSDNLTVGFKQDLFYNYLNANYNKLQVGFITCDDRFYGPIESFSAIAKRQIDDSNREGTTFWHTVFSWQGQSHVVPTNIPGLGSLLQNFT